MITSIAHPGSLLPRSIVFIQDITVKLWRIIYILIHGIYSGDRLLAMDGQVMGNEVSRNQERFKLCQLYLKTWLLRVAF